MDVEASIISQYGAALSMLRAAIEKCPDAMWNDPADGAARFWRVAYHTLFWLDYYLSETPEGFAPPAPYGLEEFDPEGQLPPRVYSKAELLEYAAYCREKARTRLTALTPEDAARVFKFGRNAMPTEERMLYNMRHVQHHAAQLNLLLRQAGVEPPRWVSRAKE